MNDDEKKLLNYAKKNKEGFTVTLKDGKLIPVKPSARKRYVVADRTMILYNPDREKLEILGKVKQGRTYGGWYDTDSRRYMIETNTIVSNREKAIRLGKYRRQKAIFDLKRMNEIRLQYPEGTTVTGFNPRRVHRVVIKKGNRYYNKITGKYTTKSTANKLNKYFRIHPDGTLYEAHSQPRYKQHEKWEKQSNKIVDLYKKSIQAVKTKDRFGNDVYYSPLLKKRITKEQMSEAMKYDYMDGQFHISLYRMTADKGRVYHILRTNINRTFNIDDIDDFYRFQTRFKKTWIPEAMRLTRQIAVKYPLHAHQVMYIAFEHEYYLTNYRQKETGAITVMQNRLPHRDINQMPSEIDRAFTMYAKLISEYSILTLRVVNIYIYSFATPENRVMSEHRLGIFKRNGKK
jgi:hypothetical protein